MRNKSELFQKKQFELCDNIINILDLNEENSVTLYELDNDKNRQENIMKLIPEIKKYFKINSISGITQTHKVKRPWMSIIRHVCRIKYTINNVDYKLKNLNIRTTKYIFILK